MKKFSLLALGLLLSMTTGWSAPVHKRVPFKVLRPIQCRLVPRESKIRQASSHARHPDGTSANWSGYAAVTDLKNPSVGSVTKVSASWVIPDISKARDTAYASIWVGIDGFASGSVEQCGTEHDNSGGTEEHYAWFEMYPKYPHELNGFPVEPGDLITAEVTYEGDDTYKFVMSNHTKNVTTTVPSSHSKSPGLKRSSAEWIVEAPASSNGILPLAHFGEVKLTDCTATIGGKTASISDGNWQFERLEMTAKNGSLKADTSELSSNGKTFSVKWKHE
jgi:hypothetical protein